MWALRRWVQLAVSNLSLLVNNHSILRVYGFWGNSQFINFRNSLFEDSWVSWNFKLLCRSRALPRQRVSRRAAVCLERVSTRPTMPAMLHERSGPSSGKFKIRDLEILVILGIRDFPCHSHARPRQCHACKEAECESRRAGVCLEDVSACPTMPALPHDRSGASLGKTKFSDFEIFVVRFGPHLPFLD